MTNYIIIGYAIYFAACACFFVASPRLYMKMCSWVAGCDLLDRVVKEGMTKEVGISLALRNIPGLGITGGCLVVAPLATIGCLLVGCGFMCLIGKITLGKGWFSFMVTGGEK